MIALLRWLILVSLLLPGVVQAKAVATLADATGERVAILDLPKWGDIPGRTHRRYCVEPATLPAIWASTLTPNGIKSDKRMLAGELIEVRCVELRKAWKEKRLRAYAVQSSGAPAEAKAALEQTNAALAATKAELAKAQAALAVARAESVRNASEVKRLEAEIHAVPPSPSWWQDYRFWMVLASGLLLLAVTLFWVLRKARNQQARVAERATVASWTATSPVTGGVWVAPTAGELTQLFLTVRDSKTEELRLFGYTTTNGGSYTDLLLKQWSTVRELGREMYTILTRYCSAAMHPSESRQVEQAKAAGMLVEMQPV